jgi:hypothetical protein
LRDSAQSTTPSSQLPKRALPIASGCQSIVRFFATNRSRMAVVRTNQLFEANCSNGVSQRQQNG